MKYKQKVLVPKAKRISVYKKTLKLLEEKSEKLGKLGTGLCLLLPSVLWNLKDSLDNDPEGKNWSYHDIKYMFPEIKEWLDVYNTYDDKNEDGYKGELYEKRIEFLKTIIKNK